MAGVETVRSAVAALNDGDLDGYLRVFDPAARRWVIGVDDPMSLTDIASTLGEMVDAFDPFELQEEGLFADGRFVCARWCLVGRHVSELMGFPAGGAEVAYRTCEVYELEGDRVIETWVYGDPGELFRQLGSQQGIRS